MIFAVPGGQCFFRAATGARLLQRLGLPADIALGGMIYRAGPDPHRDVVAFSGPGNLGMFDPQKGLLGHYWIEVGEDVIDFSAGDWPRLSLPDMTMPGYEQPENDLGDIQWEQPTPDFFWLPRTSVRPTYPRGASRQENIDAYTPKLAEVWYTGFHGTRPALDMDAMPWQFIDDHLERCCRNYRLPERLGKDF